MSVQFLEFPLPLPTGAHEIAGLEDLLAFRWLDELDDPFALPTQTLDAARRLEYFHLAGSGRRGERRISGIPEALLTPLMIAPCQTAFLISYNGKECAVYVGRPQGEAQAWADGLQSLIGGPEPAQSPRPPLPHTGSSFGCLLGHPRLCGPLRVDDLAMSPLDTLLDALAGSPFHYLVFASPHAPSLTRAVIQGADQAAEAVDRMYLKSERLGELDRAALNARTLYAQMAKRGREGLSSGQWRTSVIIASPDRATVERGLALLAGALRGPPVPGSVPLRAFCCSTAEQGYGVHANTLTSSELATLMPLPRRDRAGFAIHHEARFDVDHPPTPQGIAIGEILDGQRGTGRTFRLPKPMLCRHLLVAGQTGSGKSTTLRTILAGIAQNSIPFLVLDPVKPAETEYHDLASQVPDLAILPVGGPARKGAPPLELNPLSFPTGYPLFTHIDYLKATFTAAFGLFPPLPFLLEKALLRTYEARGWNLSTGQHRRPNDRLAYPTLSDLLQEIDIVIDAAGYAGEVEANLRGALRTRVANLCQGPKGFSLDTRDNTPDDILFERPLVLELWQMGSPQEQAFVMGLVLTRLVEVRQSQGIQNSGALRHVLVIEEAHRLLKEQQRKSAEDANMAEVAVETFVNMVAEVRAFGQGILVAEQIPSNLASNVVKQTSTKIVHRLTPQDDREAIGGAMVLSDKQKRALATLVTGRAAIHTEGMDAALMLAVQRAPPGRAKVDWRARTRGQIPAEHMARTELRRSEAKLEPQLTNPAFHQEIESLFVAAVQGLDHQEILEATRAFAHRLLRLAFLPAGTAAVEGMLRAAIRRSLTARALHYRWADATLQRLESVLHSDLGRLLAELPGVHFRSAGPFPWCKGCPSACRFAYEGRLLSADETYRGWLQAVVNGSLPWQEDLVDGLSLLRVTHYPSLQDLGPALMFCATGHTAEAIGLPRWQVQRVLSELP